MRLWIVAIFISSIFTSSAFADNSTGCGLGSMIWRKNSIVSALFRATTNHSFSSQLFGITTGTSGCAHHSIVKREMYPVYYAEANLPELRHEIALGSGEYLVTFAEVLGCNERGQTAFTEWAKNSYGTLFKSEKSSAQNLLSGLKSFKLSPASSGCDNMAVI